MKIGIIGAGAVGQALCKQFTKLGHDIVFGVRNPIDPKYDSLQSQLGVACKTVTEAVAKSQMVVLATPWKVVEKVILECGNLQGKILVDCTNPIKADFSGLEIGHTTSGAEQIAQWAKGAKVVKCFNHTGAENLNNPGYGTGELVMFAAGDDEHAVETVVDIVDNMGFKAIGLYSLKLSRQLEQMAWLWIHLAIKENRGRDLGFALLER
jgi:predicted dinucleotide-binding enzyme